MNENSHNSQHMLMCGMHLLSIKWFTHIVSYDVHKCYITVPVIEKEAGVNLFKVIQWSTKKARSSDCEDVFLNHITCCSRQMN